MNFFIYLYMYRIAYFVSDYTSYVTPINEYTNESNVVDIFTDSPLLYRMLEYFSQHRSTINWFIMFYQFLANGFVENCYHFR